MNNTNQGFRKENRMVEKKEVNLHHYHDTCSFLNIAYLA